ncbi:MAG: hypothetical protein AB8G15_05165 [Saprospiraceae bacterium]
MSSTQVLFRPSSHISSLFTAIFCLGLLLPQGNAQAISYEGISMQIHNFAFEKMNIFDQETFNESMIVLLKDKEGKDVGTLSLARMNYAERTTVSSQQNSETKVMQNDKRDVTKMDKGVGAWVFQGNVKVDQHKAQYYELDSKIARKGKMYLIETTKDQIVIKLIYKSNMDEQLVNNFKNWITDVKVLVNQSPRNN